LYKKYDGYVSFWGKFWAAAAKSRSKAAHAFKLARSERPSERQVRLCPSKAERCTRDTAAPQGAVKINHF